MGLTGTHSLKSSISPFGHLLRELRYSENLTQQELAERSNISERVISDYERGVVHRPRRDTVQLIADGLNLNGDRREHFINVARGRSTPSNAELLTPAQTSATAHPVALIGRDDDIDDLVRLVTEERARLVTLTGPGGVGKTQLAITVAQQLSNHYADGVTFVELAPVQHSEFVLTAVAHALDAKAVGDRPAIDLLTSVLSERERLLLLDNFEHLLPAAIDIAELVSRCPRLTIIVTSRATLRIRAEHVFQVEPLELPNLASSANCAALPANPAVDLFVSRAMEALPGFRMTAENRSAIAEITVRLDGIPLALELAAARMALMSPELLLNRFSEKLPLLTGGACDLPERLQTMSSAIGWSYDLLGEREQDLFRRLAVFVGGFTFDAAEYVSDRNDLFDDLSSLVRKSLIRSSVSGTGQQRFSTLETIREFGLARLNESGERDILETRRLTWVMDYVEDFAKDQVRFEQFASLRHLELDQGNIRAALFWAIEHRRVEEAVRICCALFLFWLQMGLNSEGRNWIEQTLALDEPVEPSMRAKILLGLGTIANTQGDIARTSVLKDAEAIYKSIGDAAGIAAVHRAMGRVCQSQGQFEEALELQRSAIRRFKAVGDRIEATRAVLNMGLTAYDIGDYHAAADLIDEGLLQARMLGLQHCAASALNNLALVSIELGDLDRAASLQREALDEWRQTRYRAGIANSFENLAQISYVREWHDRAATLFGAASTLRASLGVPGRKVDQDQNDHMLADIRVNLGSTAFSDAWTIGATMPVDDAIEFALGYDRRPI